MAARSCSMKLTVALSLFAMAAMHLAYKRLLVQSSDTTILENNNKVSHIINDHKQQQRPSSSSLIQLTCPTEHVVQKAENIELFEHHRWYNQHSKAIAANVTAFMDVFRNSEYDNWGKSYEEVKQGMYAWKKKRFSDLQSGARIYESACGIGLNLFMTLEILNEVKGIQNISVFGNDFVPESIRIAESIGKSGLLPGHGQLGGFCASDSSRLAFVPSDAFDLVFTGYISPLLNPLLLNDSLTTNQKFDQYVQVCETDRQLRRAAQQRQNDWYAHWVGEMIRIVKPGAPVIVEQVSYPFCDAQFDWGGVAPDFWKNAVETYGWDVDPSSIRMQDDVIFRRRYHVFLRKIKT